jgi:hypothetical protein
MEHIQGDSFIIKHSLFQKVFMFLKTFFYIVSIVKKTTILLKKIIFLNIFYANIF